MLDAYRQHIEERAAEGVPPKPLDAQQTADLIELIKNPPAGEESYHVKTGHGGLADERRIRLAHRA